MTVQLPQSFVEYLEFALETPRARVRSEFDTPFGCRIIGRVHAGEPQLAVVVECWDQEIYPHLIAAAATVGVVDPNPALPALSFTVTARD